MFDVNPEMLGYCNDNTHLLGPAFELSKINFFFCYANYIPIQLRIFTICIDKELKEFMIFVRLSVAHYFRLKDFEITGGINNDPHLIIMLLELVIYVK